MSLRDHLVAFHRAVGRIDDFGFAESIDVREEMRAAKQAVVRSKVVLIDGSVLHIVEFIDAKYRVERINYAYQYQDKEDFFSDTTMRGTDLIWDLVITNILQTVPSFRLPCRIYPMW